MARPGYNITKKRLKKIGSDLESSVAAEVKVLLHAHRDWMRNTGKDSTQITFDCRDGYYGEAFGIMRCLHIQGYGYFGSINLDGLKESSNGYGPVSNGSMVMNVRQEIQNLKWWFSQLEKEVLTEENFGQFGFGDGSHQCRHCLDRYGKDTSTILKKMTYQDQSEDCLRS